MPSRASAAAVVYKIYLASYISGRDDYSRPPRPVKYLVPAKDGPGNRCWACGFCDNIARSGPTYGKRRSPWAARSRLAGGISDRFLRHPVVASCSRTFSDEAEQMQEAQ